MAVATQENEIKNTFLAQTKKDGIGPEAILLNKSFTYLALRVVCGRWRGGGYIFASECKLFRTV